MRTIGQTLRAVFISIEFLAVVFVLFLHVYFTNILEAIGQKIASSDWALYSIFILPAVFAKMVLSCIRKLRDPDKSYRSLYYEWDSLWAMKIHLNVAMAWCFSSIIALILARLFLEDFDRSCFAGIVLAAHFVSLVCWLSCNAAHFDIDEHLSRALIKDE